MKKEKFDAKVEEAKEDIVSFFRDPNHWAYKYGSPTKCTPSSPYFLNQLCVIFEEKYFHWVTHKAIQNLVSEGFLESYKRRSNYSRVIFVRRSDVRYYERRTKEILRTIDLYSDPNVTRGYGEYAQSLFKLTLKASGFNVLDENTNSFRGKKWTDTNHDLDLIIEKDGIVYGSEIKNTFAYIPREEFEIKMIGMCGFFGIRPLCIFRYAPKSLFPEIEARQGFFWLFKAQIYPPGFYRETARIWENTHMPVAVWKEIPENVLNLFLSWHKSQIAELP